MRVLLHVCCGPCSIMPFRELQRGGHTVAGWFFNPNIHPLAEYLRRREGAFFVGEKHDAPMFAPQNETEYGVESWCKEAFAFPAGRCAFCRESRFDSVAKAAKDLGFAAFASSLLYSRRQDHEGMRQAGEKAAAKWGTAFFYQDFRPFWQEGISASKELGVYRQQYCGCVFSEEERYARDLARATGQTSLPKPLPR